MHKHIWLRVLLLSLLMPPRATCNGLAASEMRDIHRLKVHFLTSGELEVVDVPSMVDPEPEELVISVRGSRRRILSLSDLRGVVRLNTVQNVAEFVRLRTFPHFSDWTQSSPVYEIIPRNKINLGFVLGDRSALQLMHDFPDGAAGVVSNGWFKRNKLSLMVVRKIEGIWEVRRPLLVVNGGRFMVEQSLETVTPTGEYEQKLTIIRSIREPAGAWVPLPRRE